MSGQGIAQFIPLILIFVIFYFFLIRPQQKRVKDHKAMVESLKRGDEVITSGGIIGVVDRVMEDDRIEVTIGENTKVEYEATNLSNTTSIGTATFNVLPEKVGPYFIKTQCFCFEKQTLEPNQSVQMPIVFYIDPSIIEDPSMADIDTITLSYTFFKYIE